MSKYLLASLSLMLALGCAFSARHAEEPSGGGGGTTMTPASAAPGQGEEVLEMRIFDKGMSSMIDKDTEQVFKDRVNWDKFWSRHNKEKKVPNFDFKKEMVVAIVLPRNTGGFTVNLDQVVATPDGVRVVYTEFRPTEDMVVTQALTQPYVFAVVPRREGQVVFEHRVKPSAP